MKTGEIEWTWDDTATEGAATIGNARFTATFDENLGQPRCIAQSYTLNPDGCNAFNPGC